MILCFVLKADSSQETHSKATTSALVHEDVQEPSLQQNRRLAMKCNPVQLAAQSSSLTPEAVGGRVRLDSQTDDCATLVPATPRTPGGRPINRSRAQSRVEAAEQVVSVAEFGENLGTVLPPVEVAPATRAAEHKAQGPADLEFRGPTVTQARCDFYLQRHVQLHLHSPDERSCTATWCSALAACCQASLRTQ